MFKAHTFSTDWEVMVVDRLDRCVSTEKLMAFTGQLRQELGLPVNIDWNTIEFAVGINTSYDEIRGRICSVTDRAAELVRAFECELFAAGSHPLLPMFNASHIHVGTIVNESDAILLENRLLRYAPAFGALAANSACTQGNIGEFKSYRIRRHAHGCAHPGVPRTPGISQKMWDYDVVAKLYGAPTIEIRITDCASSRSFLSELATFVGAFTHHQGKQPQQEDWSQDEYREYLTNRWLASRHGLQATFTWGGRHTPVTEILAEMLDACSKELRSLGARTESLPIINQMLQKRQCQADYVLGLAQRYPDPYSLASVYAKLMRHWEIFEEYLEKAPALEPAAGLDEDGITGEHLAAIGEGTNFYESRHVMDYPPPVADELVERLKADGRLRREVTERGGVILSRI